MAAQRRIFSMCNGVPCMNKQHKLPLQLKCIYTSLCVKCLFYVNGIIVYKDMFTRTDIKISSPFDYKSARHTAYLLASYILWQYHLGAKIFFIQSQVLLFMYTSTYYSLQIFILFIIFLTFSNSFVKEL